MKKLLFFFAALFSLGSVFAVDPSQLLPPEEAFVPQVQATDKGVEIGFKIADGYYLYRDKINIAAEPQTAFAAPVYSPGKEKEDEFFGKQTVYYHQAAVSYAYTAKPQGSYKLTLMYQGCADAGVCYPPTETSFDIKGAGLYQVNAPAAEKPSARFTEPAAATQTEGQSAPAKTPDSSRFKLSWDTLNANLLAFFLAGLGLSFTACMYPLIPIVSSIVVGDKNASKGRALALTLVYTQGLALTYTLVGVIAGTTGALLTVWLQQPAVVLAAAALMVVLALSMFGLFNIQLPNAVQSYFQNQSNKLSGGKIAGVFGMGMLSALIVGPCVAPPLAFALGYIGQTGDAVLGGLALYALALGTGVPLVIIGTFGGHVLPKAGDWMNGVKYAFGFILLAVAVYLASSFLPYAAAAALYTALLLAPALLLLAKLGGMSGRLKTFAAVLSALLLAGGAWFGLQSWRGESTALHAFLTLHPAAVSDGLHRKYADADELKAALADALAADPSTPVILDFYADWCVSCKEMEAHTLNTEQVRAAVPMERFFQADVTANNPGHQALLKEYGLFGPPGVFVVKADGSRSEALLGFAKPDEFVAWYRKHAQ
ncbi:thioredoxin [Neisseria sp. oral taxon 020 str. F0370]|uniref:protein-disulfide reductase DsbD n=1 Tax=unclassified Neisseria TaxID=2623750 RepID=UPI0002A3873F|nr:MULTISPECIES: protein-disulfide reductase DsbD [unclassified Neisseria]ASP17906.1 protein-disulfide reductase DsbD [Neisseria sp. KEM232]EKY04388.1 thioredoxin [Neisseria sp. oral taxon 020 str. F0370]